MKIPKSWLSLSALSLAAILVFTIQLHSMNLFSNFLCGGYNITNLFNKEKVEDNSISVALLLDTSNSMDGLIEQAKSQLWRIVSELSQAKKNGEIPQLRFALYEYGNDRLSKADGHIKQVLAFTSDMDNLSKELFALTTNGGNEYCGQVILKSIDNLNWGAHDGALRMIYIAGNEPFTQGPISFSDATKSAKVKDVVINSIFCGNHQEGINTSWQVGAHSTGGEYSSIDQNKATVYVDSPFDDQIAQLNEQLNDTYIAFGKKGKEYQLNQKVQDDNAGKYSNANYVDRAVFKSSKNYSNAQWDLVDAYEKDKKIIKQRTDLPASFSNLSEKETAAEIERIAQKRASIKTEIQALNSKRRAYLADLSKNDNGESNLQNSILKSLKKQANRKGFQMPGDDLTETTFPASNVDYEEFVNLSKEVKAYRKGRMLDLNTFLKMSQEKDIIILDTRSKAAFDGKHLKGAIHLNFSDFTADKLAELIPDKNSKILIYCNNNFLRDPKYFAMKSAPLALNIPTFINLYGYGYKNIYELSSLVAVDFHQLEFEGRSVTLNR